MLTHSFPPHHILHIKSVVIALMLINLEVIAFTFNKDRRKVEENL